jgi:hypothetical protein
MKKYFYILAALSLASTQVFAQNLENDVDAELDQLYADQQEAAGIAKSQAATLKKTTAAAAQTQQPLNLNGSQPIYILNQAPSTATAQLQNTQVQKQPTTVIEATPLKESAAEQIRRTRQDVEVQTEQKIVEKLEQSRMEDEKKRANVLFGDKFNQLNNQQQEVTHPVAQPAPAPVPVQHVEEPKENVRDIIREELVSAKKAEELVPDVPVVVESKYVAAMAGVASLPDVRNARGNYSLGVAFGNKYDNFVLEGAFQFSNYTVDQGAALYNYSSSYYPLNVNVNQYSGQVTGKVQLFSGIIRPVLGALASYSYRNFNWSNLNSGYLSNGATAASHAFDIGAVGGVDLEFNNKYALGFDFRYMWNLASRVDSGNNSLFGTPQYGTPIEKLQYYVMSVVGRVNF